MALALLLTVAVPAKQVCSPVGDGQNCYISWTRDKKFHLTDSEFDRTYFLF